MRCARSRNWVIASSARVSTPSWRGTASGTLSCRGTSRHHGCDRRGRRHDAGGVSGVALTTRRGPSVLIPSIGVNWRRLAVPPFRGSLRALGPSSPALHVPLPPLCSSPAAPQRCEGGCPLTVKFQFPCAPPVRPPSPLHVCRRASSRGFRQAPPLPGAGAPACAVAVGSLVRMPIRRSSPSASSARLGAPRASRPTNSNPSPPSSTPSPPCRPTCSDLARWLAAYYAAPLDTVIETMLPAAVRKAGAAQAGEAAGPRPPARRRRTGRPRPTRPAAGAALRLPRPAVQAAAKSLVLSRLGLPPPWSPRW